MDSKGVSLSQSNSKTTFSFEYTHKAEIPYMISEGRMERLEDIANQFARFEKWDSKWAPLKEIRSASGAVFLCGIGLLISDSYQGVSNSYLKTIIWALTSASLLGLVLSFLGHYLHNKERKESFVSESQKMKDVLEKIKKTIVIS